ncbi:gluconate:H+ symporter [Lascolabacillus sp.]|jgi:Gnt-I system low-affinity gluconate transporter|uniref:GntP family permease n=1 Tax=Lascolabacillus sp. TaxID=1924068 RepID=UPI002586FA6C|nr:gluconate:H+ symporter [Lascolabacillus sp.]MDD2607131.1 gluconate:H+ symporter [Lascolabacillus sp.]MDD4758209.1 gluconate:H+ symporter [Lascolabacillus sp.]
MTTLTIVLIIVSAVFLLLFMVLKLKISAFISLLLIAIYVGILTGMPLSAITRSIQEGMGSTLGFVATVVGLGAIFGQMLESSGGAESMAHYLINKFGKDRAPWAMVITGFLVGIPVFFDVGFIIIVPIVYALARDTKKSLLYYAIPLLAGLAVTHSFIPPTPGPVAVADIINAQLGWVILLGFIIGLPTAIIAGPVFGKFISKKIHLEHNYVFEETQLEFDSKKYPSFSSIAIIISVPLILILLNTFTTVAVANEVISKSIWTDIIEFLGHPFSALIIATLIAIYFLCLKRGMDKQKILTLSTKALGPAGVIILITGAGGVLKQVLIDSGIGQMMAESMVNSPLPPILLAWMISAAVRVTQGSATVAMITAASLVAPLISEFALSDPQRALIVLSISSGATLLSHVNDSGFWLVGKYLGMNEKQTLQSWTVMESIIAFCGLGFTLLASLFFN